MCSTVVVTKWESDPKDPAREIAEYKARFAHLFPLCGLVFVEAKWAIRGQLEQDSGRILASRVDELRNFIRQRVLPDQRGKLLRRQLVDAWNDLPELARDSLRQTGLNVIPWRKDSLLRFLKAASRFRIKFLDRK